MAKDFPAGARTGAHTHPRAQLLYAVEGVMRVSTPSGFWALPPLRALWVPSGVPHEVEMVGAVSMRSLYIRADAASAYWPECQVIEVGGLLRELILALTAEPIDYPEDGRAGQIAALVQSELAAARVVPFQIPWPRDRRLQAICAAILDQPGLSRSIEDWGDEVGASARTLIRLFQSELGLNYRQWVQQLRLADAVCRLALGEPVARRGQPGLPQRQRLQRHVPPRAAPRRSAICQRSPHEPRASGTRRISAPLKPVPGRIGDNSARTPRRRRPRPARKCAPSVPDRPGHVWLPKPNRRKAGLSRYALESPAMSNPQHSSDAPRGKRRFSWKPFLIKTGVAVAGAGVCAAVLLGLALALAWPSLPDLHAMTDYRPRVPLRIYTADKVLIGEYGEEHRNVLRFDEIPEVMRNAVLSAEDDRFYRHGGVDWMGVARAILTNVVKGSRARAAAPSPCRWRATSTCRRKDLLAQVLRAAADLQDRVRA